MNFIKLHRRYVLTVEPWKLEQSLRNSFISVMFPLNPAMHVLLGISLNLFSSLLEYRHITANPRPLLRLSPFRRDLPPHPLHHENGLPKCLHPSLYTRTRRRSLHSSSDKTEIDESWSSSSLSLSPSIPMHLFFHHIPQIFIKPS